MDNEEKLGKGALYAAPNLALVPWGPLGNELQLGIYSHTTKQELGFHTQPYSHWL